MASALQSLQSGSHIQLQEDDVVKEVAYAMRDCHCLSSQAFPFVFEIKCKLHVAYVMSTALPRHLIL